MPNRTFRILFVDTSSYKTNVFQSRELFDGEESNETTCMDCGVGQYSKDHGPPEEVRVPYRQNAEANRRRNAAKGV